MLPILQKSEIFIWEKSENKKALVKTHKCLKISVEHIGIEPMTF